MFTMVKKTKRVKAKLARSARLGTECSGVRAMLLTVGHLQTGYYLSRIPAEFGEGLRMAKFASDGGDVYDVNLNRGESGTSSKAVSFDRPLPGTAATK